jgi:hypothetical protein
MNCSTSLSRYILSTQLRAEWLNLRQLQLHKKKGVCVLVERSPEGLGIMEASG